MLRQAQHERVRSEGGFTLIELMVVVFIIGLAAAAVILSMPGSEARLTHDGDRLAARIAAARDRAIVSAVPVAVTLRPSGYDFAELRGGGWTPLSDRGLKPTGWSSGVALAPGTPVPVTIAFDAMGMTAAPAMLTLSDGTNRTTIRVDSAGEVQLGR